MEIGTKIVRFLNRKERILIGVNIFSGVSSKLYFFLKYASQNHPACFSQRELSNSVMSMVPLAQIRLTASFLEGFTHVESNKITKIFLRLPNVNHDYINLKLFTKKELYL